MAHLESKIFNLLSTNTAVTALVADRVFPGKLKPGCRLPAISFFRISGNYDVDLGGNSGLEQPRIQVDCWALGDEPRRDLGKAVRAAMGSANVETHGFSALCITDTDAHDEATNHLGVSIDFSCWHEED